MNPVIMTILLVLGWLSFAWSIWLKFKVLTKVPKENRFDRLFERTKRTLIYAFAQAKLPRYPLAGICHMIIFWGFLVLLLRSIILWGRGYDENFSLWIFGNNTPGKIYGVLKDGAVLGVFLASTIAIINRIVNRKGSASRMTHTFEAYLILLIIWVMMVADTIYDWASIIEHAKKTGIHSAFSWNEPLGSIFSLAIQGENLTISSIKIFKHAGFWTHSSLVLIFLNILPYTKHFHVITSIPNVFFQNLEPPGRIEPIHNIYEQETYGLGKINNLSWKGIFDLYTCTECGRCSDNCPAWTTGKMLSPKQLTIDLKHHLTRNLEEIIGYKEPRSVPDLMKIEDTEANSSKLPGLEEYLVPGVIPEEVIWACTTCMACEEVCPVFITYVNKMIEFRRHLVLERGEIPGELQTALHGLETNRNPWNLSSMDRVAWAEGLDVPLASEASKIDYLLWVGCAASYDDRAKKVARAMVELMKKAGVKFAILGEEEGCTGDLARRAGNEALFQELAKSNIETLDKYGIKRIVTICPHCYNSLANEYPDFGGYYLVMTHVELLDSLLQKGMLKLRSEKGEAKKINVVYHDSCYLGRYNGIYDEPRKILNSINALTLSECHQSRNKGFCCGGGGAQVFKEEEKPRKDAGASASRMNARRLDQLLTTKPDIIATACPYCMLMLSDAIKAKDMEEKIKQEDIAEILNRFCV